MISNHKIECGVLTTRCQVPVKTFDIPYLETRIAPGTSSRNCRRRPKKKAPPGTWSTTATRWCHNLRNCSKKMSYLENNLCREHGDTSKSNELCMMFSTPVFQTHFKTLDCCLCFFWSLPTLLIFPVLSDNGLFDNDDLFESRANPWKVWYKKHSYKQHLYMLDKLNYFTVLRGLHLAEQAKNSKQLHNLSQPTNHLHIIISHIIIIQSNAVAHTAHMTHPQCNIISFTGINSYLSNQACVEKHRTFRAPFPPSDLPPNT